MRWEDERYVRVYTRDTPDWLAMQWQGRATFYELARKVDRSGFMPIGKSGNRGLAGCLHMPLDVVEAGIAELLADGCVVAVDGGLLIRNFIEAQESRQSDAQRKRSQRERDRNAKRDGAELPDRGDPGQAVTKRDTWSQTVTESHDTSHAVTDGHDQSQTVTPCRAVPCLPVPEAHTPPARARDTDDQGPSPGTVAIASAQSLLAAVGRHPMLSTLHADATWATRTAGALQGAACRAADADAAVDAFVADNAAQAPENGPALDDFVRGRGGIGAYLKRAKQHGDEARTRSRDSDRGAPASASPDVRVVIGVFGEVWAAKKGKAFAQAAGDEKHAAGIVERAWEEAAKLKMRPRDIVRHWAERHLACTDKWVVDSDHALRTMGSQLTSYGLPKPKRTGAPLPVPVVPTEPIVVPSPDIVARLTGRPIPPTSGSAA